MALKITRPVFRHADASELAARVIRRFEGELTKRGVIPFKVTARQELIDVLEAEIKRQTSDRGVE